MTSPVLRISGPSRMSTPGNLMNGKHHFLCRDKSGHGSSVKPSSRSVLPAMTRAASLASGTPMALLTKGTVRDARGLTSSR
jgi:hypothetical protein